ncbi:MAG: hypothetical protein SGILL_001437 [Bacillariaceae sp.]
MPSIRGLQTQPGEPASGSSSCDCSSAAASTTCAQEITILYQGEEFRTYLEYHATNYQAEHPNVIVQLLEVFSETSTKTDFISELSPSIKELINGQEAYQWDGGIFPGQLMGALAESQRLVDLTEYVLQDSHNIMEEASTIDWATVLPFQRYQQSMYDHQILTVPLDGDVLSMYYRRDLFERFNISVPRTWEEYQEAADFFHNFDSPALGGGRPGNNNNLDKPVVGSCVSRAPNCTNAYWTSMVLSSMTQSRGTSSGYLLDPSTTEPLLGEAMDETLRILMEQSQVGPTDLELVGDCMAVNFEMMNEGLCALTFNWGNQLLLDSGNNADDSIEIGVAPTPGSAKVLNRHTGQLEECTPELCPYGEYYEDIGIVNRPAYAAFGGWAGGVSNSTSGAKQRAVADFFSYLSNQAQSLPDVLPNSISSFADPYRYSHVKSSDWIDSNGFLDTEITASQYTESLRELDSGNSVMEFRIPPGIDLREILDQEVSSYLSTTRAQNGDVESRQNITATITSRMQQSISSVVDMDVADVYQTSLGYSTGTVPVNMNYIDPDFRAAGWGLAGLICLMAFVLCTWTLFHDRNRVMQAFQPFLLVQSAVGLFFLGATIVPLGFDDSLFSTEILDITCMATPWIYVFGFSLFFSAVYSKIRMCVKIFRDPDKYDVLVVRGMDALKVFLRIFILNGIFLALWTALDPLKWVRQEISDQNMIISGTVETFGACRGSSTTSFGMALALFFLNLILCFMGTLQAFKCRFLVLEYNEMQWLPLSLLPFFECWIIGGPLLVFVTEDPTITFILLSLVIAVSSIAAALAVFAPKDWYIRKYKGAEDKMSENATVISFPRTSAAGVRLLNHPTVRTMIYCMLPGRLGWDSNVVFSFPLQLESRKQVVRLEKQLEQTTAYNTELVNDIRGMKEKFYQMTERERVAAEEKIAMEGASQTGHSREQSVSDYETNEEGLAAMEHFASVWSSQDDDEDFVDDITEPEDDDDDIAIAAASMRSGGQSGAMGSFGASSGENPETAPTGAVAGIAAGGAALLGGIIYARKSSRSLSVDEGDDMERGRTLPSDERYDEYGYDDNSEHEVPLKELESPDSPGVYSHEQAMVSGSERSFAEDSTGPGLVDDEIYGLDKTIEADDLEALEHEAAALAEQFKLNSTYLESVSDLQNADNDGSGLHNLDISKITDDTGDSMFGSPSRSIKKNKSTDETEDMNENSSSTGRTSRPAAGESSGGAFMSGVDNLDTIEGRSMQHAGEPSGYVHHPPEIYCDDDSGDDDSHQMKPPIPMQYQSSNASPRAQDSPMSRSSEKNLSYSIADWSAVGTTGGLLADLSDSTSTSSYASAYQDSFSDLGDYSSRRDSDPDIVPLAKGIEQTVAVSEFDAVKVAAETYDASESRKKAEEKEESDRLAKIQERKEKKRQLENWRLSLTRSFEKDGHNI